MLETEVLIIGAGIVGLTLAKELLKHGVSKIIIIEKESALGLHASGRNSGVLHAGIYYPPNTLKAQLCLKGNLLLQEYCEQKNLPLIKSGKVIVARSEIELPQLFQLFDRAKQNGAKVDIIDEIELAKIEPNAKTYQKALYSHYTAVVDNKAILAALQQDLLDSNKVTILFNTALKNSVSECVVNTSQGNIKYKQLINTAGAHADTIAHLFGVGKEYCLVPFKGIYHKLIPEKANWVNGNIYPIPNLGNPFLGVHFTKNISGDVYIGPTAIPALGRENYGIFQGIDKEIFNIILQECVLFFTNSEFRKVAREEPKKYCANYFYQDAKKLVKTLQPEWMLRAAKVGIRPQLIHRGEKKLIMDFLIIKEKNTLHVLNAISPAFTSSMAFAEYLVKEYLNQ